MYAPRRDHDEHGAGARARELWDGARFRKIPLIASMVINFPLAVHDSSPSPSCSLLVVFSPSLSGEVAVLLGPDSLLSRETISTVYVNFQFNKVHQEVTPSPWQGTRLANAR